MFRSSVEKGEHAATQMVAIENSRDEESSRQIIIATSALSHFKHDYCRMLGICCDQFGDIKGVYLVNARTDKHNCVVEVTPGLKVNGS